MAGNYGDANVHALGEGNWTGNIIPVPNETYETTSYRWKDLYPSGTTINLGGTNISRLANGNMQSYELETANTNVVAYVDNQVTLLKGGANVNLDSLAEVANALNNSNTQLSTVAFTGNHSDIQSRPTISLSGSDSNIRWHYTRFKWVGCYRSTRTTG